MRLIDADEIRIKPDFILYGVCGTPVIRCEDLARIINDMPTIHTEPEIIRCRDCKYASPNGVYGCGLERFSVHDENIRLFC